MSGDITPYTDLITSEHASQPNFGLVLAALLQPVADIIQVTASVPNSFDIDSALGQQLDFDGQWVGQNRYLQIPLTNVYFSWDTLGLGWEEGSWQGQFDSGTQLSSLPDDAYRTLLRARIAANHWDGTVPAAEAIWDQLFLPENFTIAIRDNGNMTMDLFLVGAAPPDAVTQALFLGGYLDMKPVGVHINSRVVSIVFPVPTGSLALNGNSPIVGIGARTVIGAISLAGAAPVIVNGITTTRTPLVGSASFSGIAPVLLLGKEITGAQGSAALTGNTPTIL